MTLDKIKYELPEGWAWSTIGNLGIVVSGGTPSTREPQFWNGTIPWVTPADLSNHKDKYIQQGNRSISDIGLEYSSAVLLPQGSILFSSRAPIGYTAIAKNSIATNQGFKNLIPVNSINSDYVYYYLISSKQLAESMSSGTTFLELSASSFIKLPIPIPPLSEQTRIVAKIEELISELEHAIEILKKVIKELEVYRYAILANAFKKPDASKWKSATFGDICLKIQDGSHFSPKVQYKEKAPNRYLYITSKNIRNDFIDLAGVTYVNKDFHDSIYERCNPEFGDLLLTKDGVNTGNITLNTIHEPFSLLSSVCLIKPDKTKIDPAYLKYYIQSPEGYKQLTGKMTGTAIKRIILKRIRETKISFPTLSLQKSIVQQIDYEFTLIDNLNKVVQNYLAKTEVVRQSIFKKAFTGKLVNQFKDDESAEDLLQTIIKEKAVLLSEKSIYKKEKTKAMKSKKTLLDYLTESYSGKEFTYEDLRSKLLLSYEDVKDQLFILLEKGDKLNMKFDSTKKKLIYKIKS